MNFQEIFSRATLLLQEANQESTQADRFRPAVYGILFDENANVLLIKNEYRPYFHNWPGGGMEVGESTSDALKREFREETGLEVEPVALVWATKGKYYNWFRPGQQLLGLYYLVKKVGGILKPEGNGDDAKACLWYPVSELPLESLSPYDREIGEILKSMFSTRTVL